MSSGRADYWYGMLPGKPSLGIGQSDWLKSGSKDVVAGSYETITVYTVPVNYRLNLVGGMVGCRSPGINYCYLYLAELYNPRINFDFNVILPFSPSGTIVIESGETIKIRFYNLDDINNWFDYMLLGFLEYQIL